MEEVELTDIGKVCEQFNVTSRTLRYYEEEGLIESTREENPARRKYTGKQIGRIREILTLRAIGISVKEIKDYLNGHSSLFEVVNLRKAEILAAIDSRQKEIHMLNEILMDIDSGVDILGTDSKEKKRPSPSRIKIARECAEYMGKSELDKLYPYFSKRMSEYMPLEAFQAIWRDNLTGAGDFIRIGETTLSNESEDIVLQKLCFSNVNMQIQFVFRENIIHGLWMDYVE